MCPLVGGNRKGADPDHQGPSSQRFCPSIMCRESTKGKGGILASHMERMV